MTAGEGKDQLQVSKGFLGAVHRESCWAPSWKRAAAAKAVQQTESSAAATNENSSSSPAGSLSGPAFMTLSWKSNEISA